MDLPIGTVVIVTHSDPAVGAEALSATLDACHEAGVHVTAPEAEFAKHRRALKQSGATRFSRDVIGGVAGAVCLALGGDGTMLRAFHVVRGSAIPVGGVNLGRVGYLTTVDRAEVGDGVRRLLKGDFKEYPLLGLEAEYESETYQATNDVVVTKGDRGTACWLGLKINGVTLFEVSCDGVVAATPAGSTAYSLATGGPLLGISVDAYVISLVAPHALGVRPVVAAPSDILEIANMDDRDCFLDIDGQRVRTLAPGCVVRIHTIPSMTSLALLREDSLYHHFRDRLL